MEEPKLYVALDVGCIDCGESSSVLGVFTAPDKALNVCMEHTERQKKNWHGCHSFEVHGIEDINIENRVEY